MDSPTSSFISTSGGATSTTIRSNPTSPPSSPPRRECDYDVNPTYLYQAVEAKQWSHVEQFLSSSSEAHLQCSTWVIRKERDGKLRWRLLPLHAAVIFGSPLSVIELLLQEYPAAAHCKDDQGMLPLHLCFRNFQAWEIIEELLTCYPQGILVKDRKGRTPLQCACSAFRKPASVLELYTHVAVTQERQRTLREHSTTLQAKIQALQTTHISTLERLKQDWHVRSDLLESELQQIQHHYSLLKKEHAQLKVHYEQKCLLEAELSEKLTQVTEALTEVTRVEQEYSMEMARVAQQENAVLKEMVQDLLTTNTDLQSRLQDYCIQQEEKNRATVESLQALLQQQQESLPSSLSLLQRDLELTYQNVQNQLASLTVTSSSGVENVESTTIDDDDDHGNEEVNDVEAAAVMTNDDDNDDANDNENGDEEDTTMTTVTTKYQGDEQENVPPRRRQDDVTTNDGDVMDASSAANNNDNVE